MRYGWIVLGIITLFEGISGFGRTSALSPFLKDLCRDLSLTTAQISGAYTLANLLAGFVLPKIGRSYDTLTPTHFLRLYVLLFGSAFATLSLLKYTQFSPFLNFCIFLLGFACIRAAVHAYTVAGRSTTALWFGKNRGLATTLSCLTLSFIASTMPWLNFTLHKYYDWSQVWCVIGFAWIILLLWLCNFVKKPPHFESTHKTCSTKTNTQFKKNPVFWILMLALFFKAFQNTGIAFHLIPICEELGANPELITKSFMAIAVITGFVTFLLGHFFEKIGSRCIIILFLIVGCFYLFCFKQTSHAGAIYFFVFFAGCYWGMNQVVSYMVLPRVFGTDSIGSLNGWASGFMCLGSSLGPFIIGLIKDISSYQTALATCIVSACVLLIIGLAFNQKMHPQN